MIDWTQPVETTEDPPRPVRVLFDKSGDLEGCRIDRGKFDFYTITRNHQRGIWYADHGTETIPLRNVPEPKPEPEPEPVLREVWVNLYASGDTDGPWPERDVAEDMADPSERRVECRRVTWMSDTRVEEAEIDRDAWRTQCEKWAAKASAWSVEKDVLQATNAALSDQRKELISDRGAWRTKAEHWEASLEIARHQRDDASARVAALAKSVETLIKEREKVYEDRDAMRPVVDAACDFADEFQNLSGANSPGELIRAVRSHRSKLPATSESHEAMVEDALLVGVFAHGAASLESEAVPYNYDTALDQLVKVTDERDDWKRRAIERGDMLYRQAPVVDAAEAWAARVDETGHPEFLAGHGRRLYNTVHTYQQTPKKTAAEAVSNVVEMMGPVKNCTTCRWFTKSSLPTSCKGCSVQGNGLQMNWEPRHD